MIRMLLTALSTAILLTTLAFSAVAFAEKGGKGKGGKPSDDDTGADYTATDGVTFSLIPGGQHATGTSGNDDIYAGSGNDLVDGNDGADTIEGRGGDDVINGDQGNDILVGGEGNDQLFGGSGADSLAGGPGTDWLEGGDGDDRLAFSLGASLGGAVYESDHFDGNLGNDLIEFDSDTQSVAVDLALNTYEAAVTDASGALVFVQGSLYGIEDIWASQGDDFLNGSDATDNFIYGGEGNDLIYGLGGNDNIVGGQGNDVIYGGPGDDYLGGEPDADTLFGGDGNDILSGAESGVLTGVSPDDDLWGGNGCDQFVFRREFGTDTIWDYEVHTDFAGDCEQIDLSAYGSGFWSKEHDFSKVSISEAGDDIVIDYRLTRGGGTGGTIIIKDGASRGIVIDESDFIF